MKLFATGLLIVCLGVSSYGQQTLGEERIISVKTDVKTIHYHYSGNFKGWLSTPDTPGPWPVIIYNYDEYWDWAKEDRAVERGYDIKAFMKTFKNWGFACIVPIERYRKLNALKGAIDYSRKNLPIDVNRIYIIGISEGAFLSLLAPEDNLPVSKIIMISPHTFYKSGKLSIADSIRHHPPIKQPILCMIGGRNKTWSLSQTYKTYLDLKNLGFNITLKEYEEKQPWFWDHEHHFMADIYEFITGKPLPLRKLP